MDRFAVRLGTQKETIDFKTFLAGNRVKEPKRLNTNLFSFLPIMPSDITVLYAVVLGAGAVVLLSHYIESLAANAGYTTLAAAIETVTRFSFIIGGLSYAGWFIFTL